MYRISLIIFVILTLVVRFAFLDSYPFGFSGHAVGHAIARWRIYQALFSSPPGLERLQGVLAYLVSDQHAPQSLLEALLTPIFGFGFLGSRLIVSTLGLVSVAFIVMWGTVALNRWLGLCLGLSVGMAPYFLYFSRNGDSEHVNVYLQGFLLLLAAQRVIRFGHPRDYLLLGLASGLSVWVYATNQILVVIVLACLLLVKTIQERQLFQWKQLLRWSLSAGTALIVVWPQLSHYMRSGRPIPVRTPYGNPAHEVTSLARLPNRFIDAWVGLFSPRGDPWFARPHGAILDYSLLLVIPGLIAAFYLCKRHGGIASTNGESRTLRASAYFLVITTLGIVTFGVLPGVLSPENTFRRLMLVGIGLDILKGLGLYWIGFIFLKKLPRIVALISIAALIAGFTASAWRAFYFDSNSHESNSTNSLTEVVKEIRRQLDSQSSALVFLPDNPAHLARNAVKQFLTFDLGFPEQLPPQLVFLEAQDLSQAPLKNVIVPSSTLERIGQGSPSIPPGISMTNVRVSSNRAGRTLAVVDFVRN